MVKPAREGSSIGISKVTSVEQLEPAYCAGGRHDSTRDRRAASSTAQELTAAILGDEALPLIRLETPRVFYDYEAKYNAADTRYLLPCGLAREREREVAGTRAGGLSRRRCSGWGRVDLMLDRAGQPYCLEVNTIPGMTDHSLVPDGGARARDRVRRAGGADPGDGACTDYDAAAAPSQAPRRRQGWQAAMTNDEPRCGTSRKLST